ncbi:O-antigen ligase family protein [bacterium]|nr:O-antigen ligase family protein [bacterium]
MKQAPNRTPANWNARLDRLEWLLLMAMLAVVILVYPLRLQDSWLGPLNDWWDANKSWLARFSSNELRAFVSFYYSPLILKGVLASVLMLVFIGVRLARPLLGYPGRSSETGRWAWLSVPLFFGWSALSALWSPTPVISREVAFWAILHGVFLYMLLKRGVTRSEMRRLANTLIVLGAIVVAVAFFQFTAATRSLPFSGWIFKFMYQFPDERNLFGSLIGHNTGAASFAMMTAFVALGVVLGAKTEARRSFGAVYLVLALFGIVIFQSRAIWLLAPPLGLVAAFTLMRRAGMRRVPPIILAAVGLCLLVLLSQAVPNPLQRKGNMLSKRLRDLTAEHLQGETRLRLNVIGAPMVLRHPFIGHGLFAFQYVYPPVQGQYFNLHPYSKLNQTQLRSNMAHNEYLQVAIDEGLIGLVLLRLVMAEACRRGWRLRDRDLSDADALLHRTYGWACLGLALHAIFDFPLHLPQLAVPGMLCMAAWASLRRDESETESAPAPETAPAKPLALVPMLRLLGVGVLIAAVPVLSRPLFLKLESDIQANTGNGYYLGSQLPGYQFIVRLKMLDAAIKHGEAAQALHPDNYIPLMQLGDAYLMRGSYFARISRANPKNLKIKDAAAQDLYRARGCYDKAAQGLQFHYLYYQRAQVARQLAFLLDDRSELAAYRNDLERTIRLCPAFTDADYELAEFLDSQNDPASAARALELRKLVLHHTPIEFDHRYVMQAYDLIRQRRFADGAKLWEKILAVNPAKPEWIISTVSAQMYAGNRKRAAELADAMRRDGGDAYYAAGMWYYDDLLKKNWKKLVEDLQRFVGSPKSSEVVVECHVIEQEAVARAGILKDIDRFPKPASMSKHDWEQAIADRRPGILLFLIDDPAAALQAMRQRIAAGPPFSIGIWADAWYIGRAAGDKALVQQALDGMKAIDPNNQTLRDLAARTQ